MTRASLVTLFIIAAAPVGTYAESDSSPGDLREELALVVEFIDGTFDNYEQTYWEVAQRLPQELRHRRTTAIYRRVSLPEFGEHVVYSTKYWDGDSAKRSFRSLYVFFADKSANAVRMDLLTIPRPERFDNALMDLSILSKLMPDEMIAKPPECNTLWKLRGEQFSTSFAGGRCVELLPTTGMLGSLTSNSTIGRDHFIYLTTGVDKDGKHNFGPPDFVPSVELRAREFTCLVERGSGPAATLQLHDQGGAASIPAVGAVPAVSIRLRQFTPPGAIRSEGLALLLLPPGGLEEVDGRNRLTTPHAWASRDATEIGLRTDKFSVQCQLSGEKR